jgi:CRISPR-associated protein Csb2
MVGNDVGFAIEVEFLEPRYDASRHDDNHHLESEWPPHPARLFNALVSIAEVGTADDDALRWIETLGPPSIVASESIDATPREGWHVTNALAEKGYQDLPGRSAGRWRRWPRRHLAGSIVQFVWSESMPLELRSTMELLAKRIPYLGRATSPAIVSITAADLDSIDEHAVTWRPSGERSATPVTVPYSGYLAELREAFDDGRQPWEVPRHYAGYIVQGAVKETPPVAHGVYQSLLIVPFRRGSRLSAQHSVAVASRMRHALLATLGTVPASVHGHLADGDDRNQVMFQPLADVGHAHASGMILGVAVAIPDTVAESDAWLVRKAVAQVDHLALGPLGKFPFDRAQPEPPATLRPETWLRPATTWRSASLYVADRYPKKDTDWEADVRRGCARAGLPEPSSVRIFDQPLVAGVPRLSAHQRRRRATDPLRPARHVQIEFDEPVRGPIALGNMRHLGLGLFRPDTTTATT